MRDDTPATILVVDDNEANRALAEATLADEGYRVVLAASGEEGVAHFQRAVPDCVLLDVRMPGIGGFAACAQMRALPEGDAVPIVFLTAQRDLETFEEALRQGADDFLTKPVRPTELVLRVQAALKLRRLGAEVRDHYAMIRRQRDDLLRLQLQKERLIEFVVHDLKNPIGSMDLHAQLLERIPDLPERARRSVAHIRAEARAQLRLVLNLLDVSKSEDGRLVAVPGPVDVPALVADVLAALELRATESGTSLTSVVDAAVATADADLLRRVLENLVENAIRHAPEGTAVQVRAVATADGLEIRVADAGVGVPPEARELVFERFARLGADVGVARSSRGLGLTFCKRAVEAHGGRIWIEDAAPGAVFCVRLPRTE